MRKVNHNGPPKSMGGAPLFDYFAAMRVFWELVTRVPLRSAQFRLLQRLMWIANSSGSPTFVVRAAKLAKGSCMSRATVFRHLPSLVTLGVLKWVRTGRLNRFTLFLGPVREADPITALDNGQTAGAPIIRFKEHYVNSGGPSGSAGKTPITVPDRKAPGYVNSAEAPARPSAGVQFSELTLSASAATYIDPSTGKFTDAGLGFWSGTVLPCFRRQWKQVHRKVEYTTALEDVVLPHRVLIVARMVEAYDSWGEQRGWPVAEVANAVLRAYVLRRGRDDKDTRLDDEYHPLRWLEQHLALCVVTASKMLLDHRTTAVLAEEAPAPQYEHIALSDGSKATRRRP